MWRSFVLNTYRHPKAKKEYGTIDLKRIFHRGKECVGLYFDNNPTLNNLVRKLTGVKWSQTNKR